MADPRERIREELESLVSAGAKMVVTLVKTEQPLQFALAQYQDWYTRSLGVVRQLLPDREKEFVALYDPQPKGLVDFASYAIRQALLGIKFEVLEGIEDFDHRAAVTAKFDQQVAILRSAKTRIDEALANIRGVLQAELFDTELDAARELAKAGYLRAAGAVAGVVLERHLGEVAGRHGVRVGKKDPSVSDYNEALKANGTVGVPVWRRVQGLADIRNVCCHDKKREPKPDEVADLIEGVDRLTKSLS